MTEPEDNKHLTLYPYQWDFIRKILRVFAGGVQQVALVSPMGSGKSNIATYLAQRMVKAEIVKHVALFTPQETTRDAYLPKPDKARQMYPPRETGALTYLHRLAHENPPTTGWWAQMTSNLRATREGVKRSAVVGTYALLFVNHTVQENGKRVVPSDTSAYLPDDMSDTLIIMDEGHHSQGDGENKEDLNLTARMRDLFIQRGARIFYMTATPYRADGEDMADWKNVVKFYRSIARHAEEGYAPKNWRFRTHVMEGCSYNPDLEELRIGAEGVAAYWDQMGRPKTVIKVPANDKLSGPWTEALMAAFQPYCGDRVFNAVGTNWNAKAQERFNNALRTEGQTYDEIQYDVFISCKRFDEGTDWPPGAVCFQIGTPTRAIPGTLQFFGRSLRPKTRIEGYPEDFKDTSHLVYFLYDKTKGSERAPENEREHQERTLLLTAFLENCEFTFAGLRKEFRSNLPRGRMREQALDALDEVDEERRAQILLMLHGYVSRYKVLNRGKEPSLGDLLRFIMFSEDLTEGEKLAALDIFYANVSDEVRRRIESYLVGVWAFLEQQEQREEGDYTPDDRVPGERGGNSFTRKLWEALGPLLKELMVQYADRFDWTSERFLNSSAAMGGMDARTIHQFLTQGMDASDLTDEMILTLITETRERTGKFPEADGAVTLAFYDKKLTWASIARTVSKRFNGASLARFYEARDFILSGEPLTRVALLQALQKRTDNPRRKAPKVTYRHIETWVNPMQRLSPLEQRQVGSLYEDLPLPDLKPVRGQERYTWTDIEIALRRGWRGLKAGQSLFTLQEKAIWLTGPPEQDAIEEAIRNYQCTTGKDPHDALWGDAGAYVNHPEGFIVWYDVLKIRQKR